MGQRRACVFVIASGFLVACAADRALRVETNPTGAVVNIDGLLAGKAPCELLLSRRKWVRIEVLPPPESTERLVTQTKTLLWRDLPERSTVYFDLHLERVLPTQPFEVRNR